MRIGVGRLGWSIIVVVPLLLLVGLLGGVVQDAVLDGPPLYLAVVALTSGLAVALGLLLLAAATELQDARAQFLSLAFFAMAGFFVVHALTTPGALAAAANPWGDLSARLSLFVGAVLLAAGMIEWGAPLQRRIVASRHRILRWWLGVWIGYAAVAVVCPAAAALADAPVPDDSNPIGPLLHVAAVGPRTVDQLVAVLQASVAAYVVGDVTVVLFLAVIVHHAFHYRLARTPLAAGFLASGIFLAEAQLTLNLAAQWHAAWWEFHLLMLAAASTAFVGLGWEYSQTGSLATVVEGLLLRDTFAQIQRGYTEVIVALVRAVEAKDHYTRGHTLRVAEMSLQIGRELRLSPDRLRTLHQAALLHDIGKIGISETILNKPGKLTDEEFEVIKEHPVRGQLIISSVRSLRQEVAGVRYHHERLDGSGYPDGLVGDEIPLDARIIAVADVFDALTSARAYRDAWPRERALALIDSEAGTKLDARCVRALHRVLGRREARAGEEVRAPALESAAG